MKAISLRMSKNLKLELLCRNNVYELENNSALLSIEGEVDESLTYKLHISHAGSKTYLVMDKNEDGISKLITAPYIAENGVYYIQLEAIKEDFRLISNQIRLEVGSFINAENIPTPEEQSIIDNLLIKVTALDNAVDGIDTAVSVLGDRVDDVEEDISTLNGKIAGKQDTLVAGENITIEGNVISAQGSTSDVTKEYVDAGLATKQDKGDYALKSDIPVVDVTKAYVDETFATKAELDEKMEFYKIVYDGDLTHDGVVLTYRDIVDKYNDPKYFIYVEALGYTYIPALPPLEGDEIIEFTCDFIYGGKAYISRIIVNSDNEIKQEEVQIVRNDESVRTVNGVGPDSNGNINVSSGGGASIDDSKIATDSTWSSSKINSELGTVKSDLSELPQDVQINGTSIVQDGVAKIYEATPNRYGVVKVSTSYGLNMTNGFITADVMSKNKYESFPYNIVVGKGTLENIKSDLTKRALTDESQPAWTDAEKASAQIRIGILSSEGVLF